MRVSGFRFSCCIQFLILYLFPSSFFRCICSRFTFEDDTRIVPRPEFELNLNADAYLNFWLLSNFPSTGRCTLHSVLRAYPIRCLPLLEHATSLPIQSPTPPAVSSPYFKIQYIKPRPGSWTAQDTFELLVDFSVIKDNGQWWMPAPILNLG